MLRFPIYDPILSDFVNIDIPLNNFQGYAKDIEEFLDNRFIDTVVKRDEEDEEDIEESYENEEDEDDSFIRSLNSFSFFQGDKYRYGIEFPHIMRTSLFFTCFAFLENYLIKACKDIRQRKRVDLDISDLRHNGIEKAQVYLKKVAGLNFPDKSPEWNYIRKCNKVRNILIHNGGYIDGNNEKQIKEIESIKGIRLDKHFFENRIILDRSFCFEFIQKMRVFIKEVSKELNPLNHF